MGLTSGLLFSTLLFSLFNGTSQLEGVTKHRVFVYVLPTTPFGNTSVHCPTNEVQCYTLQELSTSYNFTSNMTLVLMPGVHNITTSASLDIENLESFAIIGHTDSNSGSDQTVPVIWCLKSLVFAINLRNITGLFLFGFEVHGCGGSGTQLPMHWNQNVLDLNYNASIKIFDSSNISTKNVKVYYHVDGVGLLLFQVYSDVRILNCEFSYNALGCIVISKLHSTTSFNQNTSDPYINLMIIQSEFSHNKDNTKNILSTFDRVGGLYIDLNARFKALLYNVTLHNKDNSYNLGMYLSSRVTSSKATLLNVNSVRSMTKNKRMSSECNYGGLNVEVSGKVFTFVRDSNFTGPGSCVSVRKLALIDYEDRQGSSVMQFSNVMFSDVQCPCAAMSFEEFYWVKLQDITIMNCSLGHGMIVSSHSNLSLYGESLFKGNNAGLVLTENSNLVIVAKSVTTFESNMCSTNRVLECNILGLENSNLVIFNSSVFFTNNSATKSALLLHQSYLEIFGNSSIVFDSNSGENGGAMSLYSQSQLQICTGQYFELYYMRKRNPIYHVKLCKNDTISIVFVNNHASKQGGAIFVDDSSYFSPSRGPVFSFVNSFDIRSNKAEFQFINNTAEIAGSAIYGGWNRYITRPNMFKFDKSSRRDLSVVTSNPVRVCVCNHDTPMVPNCTIIQHQVDTYPGRTVKIDAVAVGQSFGTVPFVVHTELISKNNDTETTLNVEQYHSQLVQRHCTTLQYTFHSVNHVEVLRLTVEKVNTPDLNQMLEQLLEVGDLPLYTEIIGLLNQQLSVIVTLNDCSLGFSFNYTSKTCTCHPILNEHQIYDCNIETLKITKPSEKWINATFIHNVNNDTGPGIIVYDHCPFDYCKQNSTHTLSLQLEFPDDQCDFNRSGTLCGGCQTHFSHMLGTSKCKKCPNLWVLLLTPVVVIVGVLLIITMLALNLTVSTGMMNGLILYVNIVRANHTSFIRSGTVLSYFVAWLNLDLGIEMCFYNGLDAYAKTWLQFIFPLYIWTIMIILIALSRRYVFVVRLCGSNVVQVLATLFLLSYAKLIRTIITILQPTILVYPDGYKIRVWLYDGNVDYLKGKHIPLFIAGLLVLFCLSIPYTLTLLFIQWLRKFNHHRLLRWVGKLKPLFDAYTGPFKEKHCYWFGVLLLVRVALYLVFSLNVSGDTSLNLMAIGTTTACMLSYLAIVGGVYESMLANITDVTFLLNLLISTMGAYFYKNPQRTSTISISIAFCQFVLIALYHLYLKITETRKGRQLNQMLQTKIKHVFMSQRLLREYLAPPVQTRTEISHSSIELKEPLLVDAHT